VIIKALFEYKDGTQFEYVQNCESRDNEESAGDYLWEYESFDDLTIFPQLCRNLVSVKIVSVTE
jgi:hypothetical protein